MTILIRISIQKTGLHKWHKKNSEIIDFEESVRKLIPFEQENSERVSEIQTYQVNIQEEIKK